MAEDGAFFETVSLRLVFLINNFQKIARLFSVNLVIIFVIDDFLSFCIGRIR